MPRLLLLLTLIALGGCATVNGPRDPRDPFESFNRGVYAFNSDFDRKVGKPVAEGYQRVVPQTARTGVSNFFSNLDDVIVLVNDVLQLKGGKAASDFSRLAWNTTAGLFGLIDVATPMGLPKHNEDFGQTLGYWGVPSGPYLVLPFLGPSDIRDGTGDLVDYTQVDQISRIKPYHPTRLAVEALGAVNTRANLLRASNLLEQAALDPYTFMREAYFQRRRSEIYDGNPPLPDFGGDEGLPPDDPSDSGNP